MRGCRYSFDNDGKSEPHPPEFSALIKVWTPIERAQLMCVRVSESETPEENVATVRV